MILEVIIKHFFSGAEISILHPSFKDCCKTLATFSDSTRPNLLSASNSPIVVCGQGQLVLKFEGNDQFSVQQKFLLADTPYDMILGRDFLTAVSAIIDTTKRTLRMSVADVVLECYMSAQPTSPTIVTGSMSGNTFLKARTHTVVAIKVHSPVAGHFELTPLDRVYADFGILVPRCVVTLFEGDNTVCIPFMNPTETDRVVYDKTSVIALGPVDLASTINAVTTFTPAQTPLPNTDPFEIPDPAVVLNSHVPNAETLMAQISKTLDAPQQASLLQFLQHNSDLFASDASRPSATHQVEHQIPTIPDAKPARQRPYALNPSMTAIQVTEINKLLDAGVITHSQSSWSAPVIMVVKPDGSYRMCIDYRRLNKLTVKDVYPLPRIQDMLNSLNGAQFMSSLDLLKGFYQIPVADEDRHKTAFSTTFGHYEFQRMPFGLTNAPATFQRFLDVTLAGLVPSICMVYIDDIFIFSRSFDVHIADLQTVFNALRKASLQLNIAKCHFGFTELKYLGHIITRDGLRPNPETIQSIQTFPMPSSKVEVQRFLGLANYYRRFIARFSELAEPLIALTRGNDRKLFPASDDAVASFRALKDALSTAPVLSYADFTKPFILRTDASNIGIGAILQQPAGKDGNLRTVVAYASRTLSSAERHYSATEREGLAVVWAVTHFRMYLTGVRCIVETDHSALTSLTTSDQTNSRLVRWALFLQGFDLVIKHRPGRSMADADCLSRTPVMAIHQDPRTAYLSLLHEHQAKDTFISAMTQFLEHGTLSADNAVNTKISSFGPNAAVVDGLVCLLPKDSKATPLVWVPASLQPYIMEAAHVSKTGGHLAFDKVYGALKLKYFWPTMYKDVATFINACEICDKNRKLTTAPQVAQLQPILTTVPFEIVATDVVGPLPRTGQGHEYIIVFVDIFTKFAHAYPMHRADASTAASLFMNHIVLQHGPPKKLLSDQGSIYTGVMMEKLAQLITYKHLFTSAYHPQTNGQAEKFNKTLKHMLMKFIDANQADWDLYLQSVVFAYNTTPHAGSQFSPYFLLYGREPYTPIDRMLGLPNLNQVSHDIATYITRQRDTLEVAHTLARTSLASAAADRASRFNDAHTIAHYNVGELVFLHVPRVAKGLSRSFASPWRGPYKILEKPSESVVVLEGSKKPVNVARLRLSRAHPATS